MEIKKQKSWYCPRCNEFTSGHPAISRRDNKTKICSLCGQREAVFDAMHEKHKFSSVALELERNWLKNSKDIKVKELSYKLLTEEKYTTHLKEIGVSEDKIEEIWKSVVKRRGG
jgi:uncharacterized FlgJ-related protein